MAIVYRRSKTHDDGPEDPVRKSTAKLTDFPWLLFFVAAVPVGLLFCYLTFLAPPRLPGLAGAQLSLPAVTQALADTSRWCAKSPLQATLIALGLLAGGFILPVSPGKYYFALTLAAFLTLGLSYYCLTVPIDRMLAPVQEERKAPAPAKAPSRR